MLLVYIYRQLCILRDSDYKITQNTLNELKSK